MVRKACVIAAAATVLVCPVWIADPAFAVAGCPAGTALPATAREGQKQWAQRRLDYERVWPITTGAGIRIAVVDSGVDDHQPLLAGHVAAGSDLTGAARAGLDCVGHGTFVAGLIAGQKPAWGQFAGVAPGATIVPIKVTDKQTVDIAALVDGVYAAIDARVDIINISTTTVTNDPRLAAAIADALARHIVVVAAAGNEGDQGDTAIYPAAYPGVLSVGAINAQGERAAYSQTVGVGVVAPGGERGGTGQGAVLSAGAGGDGLVANQGTSFAAPFVAGTAALVLAYDRGLTPAQVIHRIEVTADHPAGGLPDAAYGWGVVNPYAAVTTILPEEGVQPTVGTSRSPLAAPSGSSAPRPDLRWSYLGAAVAVLCCALAFVLRLITRPV